MDKYEYIVKTYNKQDFQDKSKNSDERLASFLTEEATILNAKIVSVFPFEREECGKNRSYIKVIFEKKNQG